MLVGRWRLPGRQLGDEASCPWPGLLRSLWPGAPAPSSPEPRDPLTTLLSLSKRHLDSYTQPRATCWHSVGLFQRPAGSDVGLTALS